MAQSEPMLAANTLDNAVDHLEMIDHLLTAIDAPWKWKWIAIAAHQALYGFALCALAGTTPGLTLVDLRHKPSKAQALRLEGRPDGEIAAELGLKPKKLQALFEKSPRLIPIRDALSRLQQQEYLPWTHSLPLKLSKDEKRALKKLLGDVRAEFERFKPMPWTTGGAELPQTLGHVLRVIEFIALESNCITVAASDAQVIRIRSAANRIRASLAGVDRPSASGKPLTLHAAIVAVLQEHGAPLHPDSIVAEVNRRGLYTTRHGLPVERHQIHARISNYPHLFTRDNGLIGLVE